MFLENKSGDVSKCHTHKLNSGCLNMKFCVQDNSDEQFKEKLKKKPERCVNQPIQKKSGFLSHIFFALHTDFLYKMLKKA